VRGAVEAIWDDAYAEGLWDVRLLGIDITRGTLAWDADGVSLTAEVPVLEEPHTFTFGDSTLPAVGVDVTLGGADAAALRTALGLPNHLPRVAGSTARLRAYTPGYDLGAADPLLVTGGVEAELRLRGAGLFQEAAFAFHVLPPSSAPSPDWVATADIDALSELPGGVTVTGAGLTLAKVGSVVTVGVSGAADTPFGPVSVSGTLAPDLTGTLALTFAGGEPLQLGGFSLTAGLTMQLYRTTVPVGQLRATVAFGGTATLPSWLRGPDGASTAAFTGGLANDAVAVTLQLSGARLFGVSITEATIQLTGSPGAATLWVDGRFAFGGQSLVVDGFLGLGALGPSGSLSLSVDGGPVTLAGWALDGSFALEVEPHGMRLRVDATVDVPGLADNLAVDGWLDLFSGQAVGSLTVDFGPSTRRVGGSTSKLRIGGTFTLSRSFDGRDIVTRFRAEDASLLWSGVGTFAVDLLEIASDGSIAAEVDGVPLTVGAFTIGLPSFDLEVDPQGSDARLVVGSTTLAIAGLAEGTDSLALPGFTVDTNGTTSGTGVPRSLLLDALDLSGSFGLARTGGAWRLRVDDGAVAVPGLDEAVTLQEFSISTNGSFTADATVDRIGPDALSIQDAAIELRRTAVGETSLRVVGGELHLPVGEPVDLPNLTIASDGSLARSLSRTITFGSAMTVGSMPLTLTLGDEGLAVEQTASRTFTLLGGTVTLSGFEAGSDGVFAGTVTGSPEPLGFVVPGASLTLSKPASSDAAVMTLTSSLPVDIGLVSGTATGWVSTDGDVALDVTAATDLVHFGFGVAGETVASIDDTGVSGSFTGTVCAGFCVDLVEAAIGSDGLLEGTIPVPGPDNDVAFSIPILDPGDG
jgi:hypothetical protein